MTLRRITTHKITYDVFNNQNRFKRFIHLAPPKLVERLEMRHMGFLLIAKRGYITLDP